MSKKTKLSRADLKARAFKECSRVVVVHCGYCENEKGTDDKQQFLGWFGYTIPTEQDSAHWVAYDIATGTAAGFGLACSKCGRSLNADETLLSSYLFQTYPENKRTSIKALTAYLLSSHPSVIRFRALAGQEGYEDHAQEILEGHLEDYPYHRDNVAKRKNRLLPMLEQFTAMVEKGIPADEAVKRILQGDTNVIDS